MYTMFARGYINGYRKPCPKIGKPVTDQLVVSPRLGIPKIHSPSNVKRDDHQHESKSQLKKCVASKPLKPSPLPTQSYAIPPDIAIHKYKCDISNGMPIPDIYLDIVKEAAGRGLFYGFLCTLTEEYVTHELEKRSFSRDQIYWINQAIRTFTLLVEAPSISKIIISPISTFLLIKILGMEESAANNVTMGVIIGLDLITNQMGTAATVGVVAVSLGCSIFSSRVAKEMYRSNHSASDDCIEVAAVENTAFTLGG